MLYLHSVEQSRGLLHFKGNNYKCALGKSGVRTEKKEGDGATPIGKFFLRRAFYRPDRLIAPRSELPINRLTPADAWCDDPNHYQYNQLVKKPFKGSHEELWRVDNLYDLIIVFGYNDNPPQPYKGSAIFIHCTTKEYKATKGCLGLILSDLLTILPEVSTNFTLDICSTKDLTS